MREIKRARDRLTIEKLKRRADYGRLKKRVARSSSIQNSEAVLNCFGKFKDLNPTVNFPIESATEYYR